MKYWLGGLLLLFSISAIGYESGRVDYNVVVGKWQSEYRLMSFFLLPGETVDIRVFVNGEPAMFASGSDPEVIVEATRYTATAPGEFNTLNITPVGKSPSTLQFFTLHPSSEVKNQKLNGYMIGEYPKERLRGLAIYDMPRGFLEVRADNVNTKLSPHYSLKQFPSKQKQGYPKYVVLQTRLLRKLEFLTEQMNHKGYPTNGFHIMSGYRTPYYNALIKNRMYSRHQWGGAADIFIDDNPKDGVMDDLNNDGKINIEDARLMGEVIETLYPSDEYEAYIGGLGLYRANAVRGPFIHVDVRGSRARW